MSHFNNRAFQQSTFPSAGFNLVTQNNSFSSVFDPKPLEGVDATRIEQLLVENLLPGTITEVQLEADTAELKRITAEIRAIGKQSIILMGERVHRVSELLKPYRDGTFTKWLENTFGSRKSGYNALSYYSLYNELPDEELKQKFKKMPQKTAYILASRKGADIEAKAEIVREFHDMSHDELVSLIQEKMPLEEKDRRSQKNTSERFIAIIRGAVQKLQDREDELTEENRSSLSELAQSLSLLSRSL